MSSSVAICREHAWERHLEVRNKHERVIRVCANCGRREMCWEQPRRKGRTPRPSLIAPEAPEIARQTGQ
jgi:hypothetical protein